MSCLWVCSVRGGVHRGRPRGGGRRSGGPASAALGVFRGFMVVTRPVLVPALSGAVGHEVAHAGVVKGAVVARFDESLGVGTGAVGTGADVGVALGAVLVDLPA